MGLGGIRPLFLSDSNLQSIIYKKKLKRPQTPPGTPFYKLPETQFLTIHSPTNIITHPQLPRLAHTHSDIRLPAPCLIQHLPNTRLLSSSSTTFSQCAHIPPNPLPHAPLLKIPTQPPRRLPIALGVVFERDIQLRTNGRRREGEVEVVENSGGLMRAEREGGGGGEGKGEREC